MMARLPIIHKGVGRPPLFEQEGEPGVTPVLPIGEEVDLEIEGRGADHAVEQHMAADHAAEATIVARAAGHGEGPLDADQEAVQPADAAGELELERVLQASPNYLPSKLWLSRTSTQSTDN